MKITVSESDTFKSLATQYTIGDAEYTEAIARHNNWPLGTNATLDGLAFTIDADTPVYLMLDEVEIPDDWLKNAPESKKSLLPLLAVAAGVLVFATVDSRKLFR